MSTEPITGTGVPTQLAHPWRATVRTVLAVVVGLAVALPAVWSIVVDELAKQNVTVPDTVQAVAGAVVAGCVVLIGVVQRVALIPQVADILHRWGLGPTPKG